MKRTRPAACQGLTTPLPTYKTSALARALKRRCTRAPTALCLQRRQRQPVLSTEFRWRGSRKQLRLEVTAPPPKGTLQFGSEVTPIRWDRMLTASQRPGYHQVLKRPAPRLRDSLRPRARLAPQEAWQ